jgi:hypothetical protein
MVTLNGGLANMIITIGGRDDMVVQWPVGSARSVDRFAGRLDLARREASSAGSSFSLNVTGLTSPDPCARK